MFWDSNGLLNSRYGEEFGENSFLYTLEYGLIQNLIRKDISIALNISLSKMNRQNGIYLQHPTNFDQMSHDQLTAIFIALYNIDDKVEMERIFNEIVRQKFHYDIINPDKPNNRLHPRDIIYYAILCGKFWGYLLLPILVIMFLVSMFSKKERTNGKILWFVRGIAFKSRLWKRIYFKLINHILSLTYGKDAIYEVFKIYFPSYYNACNYEIIHPINELLEILKIEGIDND